MALSSFSVRDLIPMIQVAIGPVILISGVGLLLLTLSNRFGRAVDRSRQLMRELPTATETEKPRLLGQISILYQRARLIRLSITLAAVSVLLAALLIIVLFLTALFHVEVGLLLILIFVSCLLSLIISLIAFIREINQSLVALKMELNR